jgi:fucose permease
VRVFVFACLAYLITAFPASALGLLWPSMRLSIHQPVGALGILLAVGVAATVLSSAATGRVLAQSGMRPLVSAGVVLCALALAVEAAATSLGLLAIGFVLFGLGFGATDAAVNWYAAGHFGARRITWMHASYGLGATVGPLLATALLSAGLSWRWVYGSMAVPLAVLGGVLALARRGWASAAQPEPAPAGPAPAGPAEHRPAAAAILASLTFVALETGIESAAGIWGYLFLTAGRGLSSQVAGVAVAAYWAMMCAGRAILGPVAQSLGAARVLDAAVAGVAVGAAVMAVPGPGFLPVAGLMILGLATAQVFPLFILTMAERLAAVAPTVVSLQVASSAFGGATLPAAIGLLLGGAGPRAMAPALLGLGLAMGAGYGYSSWRRIHISGGSPSLRPSGARSRKP